MITKVEGVVQIGVSLDHVAGAFAEVAEALAKADINIHGVSRGDKDANSYLFHLVVDKADEAIKIIEAAGKTAMKEHVVSIEASDDEPGLIAKVTRTLANANINIETLYHASLGRGEAAVIYIGVNEADYDKTLQLVQGLL